jgi:hypothetical protein
VPNGGQSTFLPSRACTNPERTNFQKFPAWLTPRRKFLYWNSPFACSDLCPSRGAKFPNHALTRHCRFLFWRFRGSNAAESQTVRTGSSATSDLSQAAFSINFSDCTNMPPDPRHRTSGKTPFKHTLSRSMATMASSTIFPTVGFFVDLGCGLLEWSLDLDWSNQ